MAITRTAWTDDDGSGLTGTLINNAEKTSLYDQIDGRWSEVTTTLTGTQNALDFSQADVLYCNNATLLTIGSLLAPASPVKPGKRLMIVSVGAGQVDLHDVTAGSGTAANRIITGSSITISLAPTFGRVLLEYDDTFADRWRVIAHEQGDWITYTPTWVGSGSNPAIGDGSLVGRYYLRGKVVDLQILVVAGSTTTYGTGTYTWALPLTAASAFGTFPAWILDNSAGAAYIGIGRLFSTTTVGVYGTANPAVQVAATSPVTFAVNDQIWISGTYRLA